MFELFTVIFIAVRLEKLHSTTVWMKDINNSRIPCSQIVFRPSYDDYDVVIHLQNYQMNRLDEALDATNTSKKPPGKKKGSRPWMCNPKEDQIMPIVMFDPAYFYIKELRVSGSVVQP